MKGLTDIPGIRVGHVSDYQAITGCTAVLCEGAVCGVDLRPAEILASGADLGSGHWGLVGVDLDA